MLLETRTACIELAAAIRARHEAEVPSCSQQELAAMDLLEQISELLGTIGLNS
ncbi:hypothetical protein [Novosphingobium aromaticivorans]|uniref:hypothetical protein n=1 Tax=Novosphingobium aromaticivorans TaxID=48935 RepID=UPI00003C8313|nr:hypothetical protein [Novosphingobium aromaticivorans]